MVFYNGAEKRPEYEEMNLSQLFANTVEKPDIEVRYTFFVEKVRYYKNRGIPLDDSVDRAIADCIGNHILEDFFLSRKDEVKKMTHLDYTWEKRENMIRKEEYEQGGRDRDKKLICKWMQKGRTVAEIAEMLEESEEYVKSLM